MDHKQEALSDYLTRLRGGDIAKVHIKRWLKSKVDKGAKAEASIQRMEEDIAWLRKAYEEFERTYVPPTPEVKLGDIWVNKAKYSYLVSLIDGKIRLVCMSGHGTCYGLSWANLSDLAQWIAKSEGWAPLEKR
jgi:hypothetical protein